MAEAVYGSGSSAAPQYNDEQLARLVVSRKEHSIAAFAPFFAQVPGWYNSYQGIYTGDVASWKNNIALPALFSVVWSDVANKVQSTFGAYPVVSFHGFSPEDSGIAKKNEVLISAQMQDAQSFRKAVDFYVAADLYGTAVARVGWTNITRLRKWRQQEGGRTTNMEGMVTQFDGPDWNNVDILDFWPQAGIKHIADMQYATHRYYDDFDNLMDDANGPNPIFSKTALAQLKDTRPIEAPSQNQRWGPYQTYDQYSSRRSEQFAKPVELWDHVGLVPSEFAPDGVRLRIITIGNGKVVLRNDPFPYWHGRLDLMFRSYSPLPDPHYFHGMGKVRIGDKMQAAMCRLMNQNLDSMDLFDSPMYFGNAEKLGGIQNLFTKPGRIFPTDGNPNEIIMPMIPNMQGLQYNWQGMEQLNRFIEKGTSITEGGIQGLATGSRTTAREFMGKQEQALSRLALEAMLASAEFVEPLAEAFRALNIQHLQTPKEVKIIGTMAEQNQITGLPYPSQPTTINLNDLFPDYRARAVGPLVMMTRGVQQQNAMQLVQLMTANPVLLQATNWVNVARKVYDLFDWPASEFLNQQLPLINQLAGDNNLNPEDVLAGSQDMSAMMGGAGGQQMEQLSPDMLGNQINSQLPPGA